MNKDPRTEPFLASYSTPVYEHAMRLRETLHEMLPGVTEQCDESARMIAFCYGQKYTDMVCSVFPSKKGLKLSFYKGVDLPDPSHILEGNAKTTRYLEIRSEEQIGSPALKELLREAFGAYQTRTFVA